ncbi:MAG: serine/threonine-protein phosphatase [Pseudonocardia sp.]|nr:serine/threonine-protein phosphatase [Pseudonocardia sp.]
MSLVVRYRARSDLGLVRRTNQDAYYAGPRVLALADGVGGRAGGECAARLAISAMIELDRAEPGEDLLGALRAGVAAGNAAIGAEAAERPELAGMATTLTAMLFAGHRLGLAHVGDSRAYLLRDAELRRITKDDTFVRMLIDEGQVTPAQARAHPMRSVLLRSLSGGELEPSLRTLWAHAGDRYLLCSDGLSDVVDDEDIGQTLAVPDQDTAADKLIEQALAAGGPDNVTVVLADVLNSEPERAHAW